MKLITNTNKNIENIENLDIKDILNNMVDCPISSCEIGSPESEIGREKSEHLKIINITVPFKISKYLVTQKQYEFVMGNNPSFNKNIENAPVENITWYEAKVFCQKLNQMLKSDLPIGYEFDLPTENQWEYACRAGAKSSLYNGKDLTAEEGYCSNLDEIAWYFNNSDFNTHSIALKNPNNWEIFDMLGNVWEWCNSSYEFESNKTDNVAVIRGGCYRSKARKCRCAQRSHFNKNSKSDKIGFRVALVSRFNTKKSEILKLPQNENDEFAEDDDLFYKSLLRL